MENLRGFLLLLEVRVDPQWRTFGDSCCYLRLGHIPYGEPLGIPAIIRGQGRSPMENLWGFLLLLEVREDPQCRTLENEWGEWGLLLQAFIDWICLQSTNSIKALKEMPTRTSRLHNVDE